MVIASNFSQSVQRLFEAGADVKSRLGIVSEIRDSIEIVHTSEYGNFLSNCFKPFKTVLETTQPQDQETSEHRLRNVVLEILNRLPQNETLRPYVPELMELVLDVLEKDKEENALVCIRIIFDLHKNYRPSLEPQAQRFLQFVCKVYNEFENSYRHYFVSTSKVPSEFAPSYRSFKVINECPLVVMFILQLYTPYVPKVIPQLLPAMRTALDVAGPSPVQSHHRGAYLDLKTSQVKTVSFLTFLLRTHPEYIRPFQSQLAAAIVKLLSCCPDNVLIRKEILVGIRHVLTTDMRSCFFSYVDTLMEPRVLMGTGLSCTESLRPLAYSLLAELIHHGRKELSLHQLSRVVHIFALNVHDSSLPVSVQMTCVRLLINLIEALYGRRNSDSASSEASRSLLGKLLTCFLSKLTCIAGKVDTLLELAQKGKESRTASGASITNMPYAPIKSGLSSQSESDVLSDLPILYIQNTPDEEKELADTSQLVLTVLMGLKTLLFSICHYRSSQLQLVPGMANSQKLNEPELRFVSKLFVKGTNCLRLFFTSKEGFNEAILKLTDSLSVLDAADLSDIFGYRMPAFFDLLSKNNKLSDFSRHLLGIYADLYSYQGHANKIILSYGEALAEYLVSERFSSSMESESMSCALSITLMRQVIACASKSGIDNAVVCRVVPLLDHIFEHISNAEDKEPFLILLKELFNSLQGCKNDVLHRQFKLNFVLTTLQMLLGGPVNQSEKFLLIELVLTLPTRLSTLLHFLPQLMKPLLLALRSTSDSLISLGLKTLEYWIDSLNPEFLEPAMAEILPDLMACLHSNLGPTGLHPFGHKSLTLLGKLGGRNRRYLKSAVSLDYKTNPEHGLRLILTFEPSTSFLVPMDKCIALAINTMNMLSKSSRSDVFRFALSPDASENLTYFRVQALHFLQTCLASVLNLRSPQDSAMPGNSFDKLREMLIGNQQPPHIQVTRQKIDFGVKTVTQLQSERHVLRSMLAAILGASHDEDISNEALPFAEGVCRHFAMLFAAGASAPPPPPATSRGVAAVADKNLDMHNRSCPSSLKEIDPHVFLDSVMDIMSSEFGHQSSINAVVTFTETLLTLHHVQDSEEIKRMNGKYEPSDSETGIVAHGNTESKQRGSRDGDNVQNVSPSENQSNTQHPSLNFAKKCGYPQVLDHVLSSIVHACYGDLWSTRVAAFRTLKLMKEKLPLNYLALCLPSILRALFLIVRWLPHHFGHLHNEIQCTLEDLISKCLLPDAKPSACKVAFRQEMDFFDVLSKEITQLRLPLNSDSDKRTDVEDVVFGILEVMNSEIFGRHSSRKVRSAVGKCLQVVCKATHVSGCDLLRQFMPSLEKKRLVPLRHVEVQIGTALAVTFCLRQKPELISTPSADLLQVFKDALTIVEHDDSVLGAAMAQHHGDVPSAVLRLRTVCIELLCSAVAWPAFRDEPDLKSLKEPIIRVFFKSLTSDVTAIVSAAKEGIRHVTASHPRLLPKELLQTSLKPLLMNLAIHTSLNLPLLKGLSHLLDLLSMWFNPNLGDKLLGHLRQWLKPNEILSSSHAWSAGQEVPVAAAIMELFHLLPQLPRPYKFLESSHQDCPGLVVLTIELENLLHSYPNCPAPSKLASPYQLPLTKFLSRYASEAVVYFLDIARMQNSHYFFRFINIVKSDDGSALRHAIIGNPDCVMKLISLLNGDASKSDPDKIDAELNAVYLVSVLLKFQKTWMLNNKDLFASIMSRWRSPSRKSRMSGMDCLKRSQILETPRLARCLMIYLKTNLDDVEVLLELLDVYRGHCYSDITILESYLTLDLLPSFSLSQKKFVLRHILTLKHMDSSNSFTNAADFVLALKYVVRPLTEISLKTEEGKDVVDSNLIEIIIKQLLDSSEEKARNFEDGLRIELLHLATTLIKYIPEKLVAYRKELIKFGWNHLKREDSSCKYFAFVNVCQFLQAYQAPEKIILQVYVALLRTCQTDVRRPQVSLALDILLPALPIRMQQGDHKFPVWIRYTKKILVEEGHSLSHLVHIWQLIVRHSNLFYSSRSQFIPQMVNSLNRLGLPQNAQSETRRLSIDLATLVLKWEHVRFTRVQNLNLIHNSDSIKSSAAMSKIHDLSTLARLSETDSPVEHSGSTLKPRKDMSDEKTTEVLSSQTRSDIEENADDDFDTSSAMQDMVANFLVRMSFVLSEHRDKDLQALVGHLQWLIHKALLLWPSVSMKLPYLEKMIQNNYKSGLNPAPSVVNGLQVMHHVFTLCSGDAAQKSLPYLKCLINPSMMCTYESVINMLVSVLDTIFQREKIVEGRMKIFSGDLMHTLETVTQKLLFEASDAAIRKQNQSFQSISNTSESQDLKSVPVVTQGRNKLDLETLHARLKAANCDTPSEFSILAWSTDNKLAYGTPAWNTAIALEIAGMSCDILASEHRKAFMQTLAIFMSSGKSTPPAILMSLLNVLNEWLLAGPVNSTSLTSKEIILFLQRLAQLERAGATSGPLRHLWERKFLNLIHMLSSDIDGSVSDASSEVFGKVERVFLLGLRASDPEQRHKFLDLYSNFIDLSTSSVSPANVQKSEESKLFKRLQFIITVQDWEALSNRFWLNQCLDLLLSILVEDEVITLAPNSAQIPPLLSATKQNIFTPASSQASKLIESEPSVQIDNIAQSSADVTICLSSVGVELPHHISGMIESHNSFLEQNGKMRVKDLVFALRELCHADNNVAYHCWVLVFPIVWATLQKENQVQLAKPLISLLSKEYHVRQSSSRPNVVQALLEGISLSQPQPKIPSELIKFLGKTYNSWHIAIPLLESHVMLFPQEIRCFDSLAALYRQLNEHDMLAGLWKKRCAYPGTQEGLSFLQHGHLQKGQEIFGNAITQAMACRSGNQEPRENKSEQSLWIEKWCICANQLNQWEHLIHFYRDLERTDDLLSCLWKVPDWKALRALLQPQAGLEDSVSSLMSRARLSLHDASVSEAQELIHKCAFRSLHFWWQLPEVGLWPRVPLLENLQPLVELQESSRILSELSFLRQNCPDHMYSDLKDIMETWRLRLPNEWENLLHWCDVLIWRNHVYNIIISNLNEFQDTLPQLHQLGYRDKAWSVNQLGAAARKQGLHTLCISTINSLYGYNRMDVQEAFAKIREQAKAYLMSDDGLVNGLNLITTTNLEYFKPDHQAEIFRLKGMFYSKLGENDSANNAFSASILLNRGLSGGWLSWGKYYDTANFNDDQHPQFEAATTCYVEALRTGLKNSSVVLPRLLYLLAFENSTGQISQIVDQSDLPTWTLLFWIPQLLVSLQRDEVATAKKILTQVAIAFPQALYYALRTFLLSLRESAIKQLQEHSASRSTKHVHGDSNAATGFVNKTSDSEKMGGVQENNQLSNEKPPEVVSFEAGREIMESLRSKHGALVQVLESLLTEIGSRFVPKPAERLLAVVHMLLHRCYKAPCANIADVPGSLRRELGGVCKACFSLEQIAKHSSEMKRHRESFLRDLDPESASFPKTLGQLVECLKGWKVTLNRAVEHGMPVALKLEMESRMLQDLSPLDVEIPGQYLDIDSSGAAERPPKLERIGGDIYIIRRHGSSYRRLKLFDTDGYHKYFLVQTPGTGHWSTTATSDERIMQLLRIYSKLLLAYPESRRRHLTFHTPVIVTIWPQVRLLQEEPSYCSFGEAYEVNCARYGREPDLPITHFKDRCCTEAGQILPDPNGVSRLAAYKDIESGVVSENVLSQYMYKTLPSCNHLWTFKKQFCGQYGLCCLMCILLQIGGRAPNKILFAKNSGLSVQMDLYPVYDSRGLLECNEPVPFRLTRNLVTFFTPFGVEGVFTTSICCAASACSGTQHRLSDMLRLFFRDDISSTQIRRANKSQSSSISSIFSRDLVTLIKANVEHCESRIDMLAPAPSKLHEGHDLQAGAARLLDLATNPQNLCRMDPTWHPWF